MTTQQLAESYFVLDVPDVRWTDAADGRRVRVVISPQNGEQVDFSENYTPDNNNAVTLRGLSELIQPYVKPCPTPMRQDLVQGHGVWLATVVRASFTAQLYDEPEEGQSAQMIGQAFHSYAYYASRRTTATPGSTAMWLTRYTERTVLAVQPLTLSVLLVEGLTARFVVEGLNSQDELQTVTVPIDITGAEGAALGTAPAYAAVIHYSIPDLTTAAALTKVLRVTAELLREGRAVDSVTFHIDYKHHAQQRVVAFTNCFGMLETEAFTGADDVSTELEAEYAWMDREYEKTCTREVTQHRLAARFTGDTRRDSLRDITASPELFLIHDEGADCWQRMTLTAFEMTDRRPHTAPQTAYITLRPSAMHQEEVARRGDTDSGEVRHRIFDYTFDETFN